jgi:type 1 glutamine amidotransferase/HEAT repeat protein
MKHFSLFAFLLLFLTMPRIARGAPSLPEALAKLESYDAGQSNAALLFLEEHVGRISGDASQREQFAAQLAVILSKPQTKPAAKLFICQQLRIIGGKAQVPLLAAMLESADTADMSRFALEAMPGETVSRALISALSGSADKRLIGIINSLGARREPLAVDELSRLLSNQDTAVACAAALALGKVGTTDAARALISLERTDLKSTVWDALLLCAQNLAAAGSKGEALRLYNKLSEASDSSSRRICVLAGTVRADPAGSLPRIMEALTSDDPEVQAQAATLSVMVPSEDATKQLAGRLASLTPNTQRALLRALAERGDRSAAATTAELVGSADSGVRLQALEALGRIGTAAILEKLLEAGIQGPAALPQAARKSLELLSAPQVDDRLLELAQSGQPPLRSEAMLALAVRHYQPAVPALLRIAGENNAILQAAAFGALGTLAGPEHYASVIDLLLTSEGPVATEAAEHAVVAIANRLPDADSRTQPLLKAFTGAKNAAKPALLRVIGSLGGPDALRLVVGALKDRDEEIRDAACRTLADWPDLSAGDELLKLSLEAEKSLHHTLALRGYLRLALEAKSGQAALLARAIEAAKSDADKRALLGALAESGQPGALETATKLLSDAAVGSEAALVVVNLATKVGRQDPSIAEAALKQVVETSKEGALKARAEQVLLEGWSAAETAPAPYNNSVGVERQKQLVAALLADDKLVAYLDCGVTARVNGPGGIVVRQLNGKAWNFELPGLNPAGGTVAFDGRAIEFELAGLDQTKAYALGFSWWDGDGGGRSQSVQFIGPSGANPLSALPVTRLPSGADNKPPATIQVPLPTAAVAQGRARVAFTHETGPNVIVGELWLIETTPRSRTATQVVQAAVEVEKPKPVDLTAPADGTRILLVTGIDYPGHPWRQTAPALKAILDRDSRLKVRIVEDPNALASPKLKDWDLVIIHFMDWEKPGPGPEARENLKQFVSSGKGLMLTHFACGAWDGNEWPEFARLAGRVWDPKLRGHDPHGNFTVEIADPEHPITKGMQSFETLDELYTCLAGDTPIHVVVKATSKVDKKEYPIAFVLNYGKGRVFHSVLGHDARAYAAPGVGELMRRGCAWAAGLEP